MFDNLKEEFDKGMPITTYIKKKYGFDSVEEFEAYIKKLKEKADKYDEQQK
ncbi:hypothetical protein [Melissococcus sp. OM08-11BH]|uniref:hypothetical protein n=1 Tax=Melissococcus sp. OM08-11BH TaxID=2293110 RepID=UPI00131428EB|nr:hypothetical protein [Melissococcus sp. OM08-11BH]